MSNFTYVLPNGGKGGGGECDSQQMFFLGGCLILISEGQMIISIIQLKTHNVAFCNKVLSQLLFYLPKLIFTFI